MKPIDQLDTKFFYYFLKSIILRDLGYARHFKLLKQVPIPLPSLSEQGEIVAYLDKEFALIDALREKATLQLQAAKDLFQSALKQLLTPQQGWEEKKLGEVVTFSQGIQVDVKLQSTTKEEGMVRFLRIVDFTQGDEPPRYIEHPGDRYYLYKDEIAMVRYGTVGYVCYGYEGIIANNLFKININNKNTLCSPYLQYFLKSELFQSHIRKGVGGTALPAIKFGDIKHIELGYPPLSEQEEIVRKLDAFSEKCRQLEENYRQTITLCNDLKQALLRQVFE